MERRRAWDSATLSPAASASIVPFNRTAAGLMAAPAPLALPGGQGWAHGWAALPGELVEAVAERLAGRER